jgi:hypothetical protein
VGVSTLLVALYAGAAASSAHPLPGAEQCPIFPADNSWNLPIASMPVAAGSSTLIREMGLTRLHPDFSDSDGEGYGIPYNVVSNATATSQVTFDYADESDDVLYPIPASPQIEGGSDRHILMVNADTCRLDELFAAEMLDGQWNAGSGATWDLGSNALRPLGWTSADAAGLPILPGLARYEDIPAGGIDHALRITLPVTQRAYLWPARHHASSHLEPWEAPMGLRIRVKASYAIGSYGPQTQAILRAGKKYGFIVADNGSAGYISGAPDPGWDDDDLHALQNVPASAFEVVDVSSVTGTPTAVKAWNTRFTRTTTTVTAHLFHSRSGPVRLEAVRNGAVVRAVRISARQGYVRISIRRATNATYRIRLV